MSGSRTFVWPRAARAAGIGFVVTGLFLRIVRFLQDRSLWLDELQLSLNIVDRDFAELLTPLEHKQAAPPGFLLLERLSVVAFGDEEWALRLPPLLFGLLALVLFARLCRERLPPMAGLVALALFALNAALVEYSSEVKQYSVDVAATTLVLLLASRVADDAPAGVRRAAWRPLAVAGAVVLWFSHAVAIVLVGVGAALLLAAARGALTWRSVLAVGALWGSGLWIHDTLFAGSIRADEYFRTYFGPDFAPHPFAGDGLRWYARKLELCLSTAGGGALRLLAAAALLGVAALARRRERAVLLLGGLVGAFVLSSLELYPFRRRFLLFLVPGLLLVVAEGVALLAARGRLGRAAGAAIAVGLLVLPALTSARQVAAPPTKQEARPLFREMARRLLDGDHVHVHHRARMHFDFYAPRTGLAPTTVSFGRYHDPDSLPALRRELVAATAAPRNWIVVANLTDAERDHLLRTIETLGALTDLLVEPGVAAVRCEVARR
ncbi:MAG: glycosyltransferase family 39 protein [Planctomycetota bacterium JB042]